MKARSGKLLPALVVIAVLLVQGRYAWQVLVSDLIVFNVQRDMVFWGNAGSLPEASSVAAVNSEMDRALALRQLNPDFLALKARLQAWEALLAKDNAASLAGIRYAAETMQISLQERPSNPYSWLQLAEYLRVLPDREVEFRQALDKVRELGPGDPTLQQRVMELTGTPR
jgi:hypothetical protein